MPKFRMYRYLILVFLFLVACKPVTTTLYFDLIRNPECSLPCWGGIEIDKTSFSHAQEILAGKYGADGIDVFDEKSIKWKAHGVDGLNSGYISFHENIAVDMLLFFEDNTELTVENLIEILGKPTWVFVNNQPTIRCNWYHLEYPSLGIYGSLEMLNEFEDIQVSSQILMLRFLQTRISEDMQVYDGYLVKWDGYKNYCE